MWEKNAVRVSKKERITKGVKQSGKIWIDIRLCFNEKLAKETVNVTLKSMKNKDLLFLNNSIRKKIKYKHRGSYYCFS